MLTHFWENRTLKVGSNLQSNIVFMFEGKSHEFLERQIILFPYFVQNEINQTTTTFFFRKKL